MAQSRNIVVGTVEGTGAAINISVGFTVASAKFTNIDGLCTLTWTSDMPAASGMKAVTAGTISKITSNGVSPYAGTTALSEGVTLGADADVNVNGETLVYELIGAE